MTIFFLVTANEVKQSISGLPRRVAPRNDERKKALAVTGGLPRRVAPRNDSIKKRLAMTLLF